MTQTDRELLEVLAREAPAPRPGLADEVVTAGRRRRQRTAIVLGAIVGVTSVVTAAVLMRPAEPEPVPAPLGPATSATSEPTADAPGAGAFYAAAVEFLAREMRFGPRPWRVLYVLDQTCPNVLHPVRDCGQGQPLSDELRTELTSSLRDYAPVRFVDVPETAYSELGSGPNGSVLVTLGTIEQDGANRAVLSLSLVCGGLCGQGRGFEVTRDGETFVVEDHGGARWIS